MIQHNKRSHILRDLSWLSFNERVMQEARDHANHLYDRLRFLGIFSNNQDEFFRVRVAALNRMTKLGKPAKMDLEENAEYILDKIQRQVIIQQIAFDRTYHQIINELSRQNIHIKNEHQLNETQTLFIKKYFEDKVRTQIVPIMIESISSFPFLHDKSIYLACVLKNSTETPHYSLIEIPTKNIPRFILLPSEKNNRDLILIEDIIRWNLPQIFSVFNFHHFSGYIIKVTRDAELDLDNDINVNVIESLEKGIKNRKKGKATRFVYDRDIDPALLVYLTKRLHLTKKDNLIAGGRIHNFKDFMQFPIQVFKNWHGRQPPFVHPALSQPCRMMEVIDQKDVLLHFPYHSFDSIIDLLREAAIDPFVESIKITCYRLAEDSKIINALINAVRNGKSVMAVIELHARFDEEANLRWKNLLEEEGVRVIIGFPNKKVHAKLCLIKKRIAGKTKEYGFFSTGNLNENTALYYGDHCLLTSRRKIIADIKCVFNFFEFPQRKSASLRHCKTLAFAPYDMREYFIKYIESEILAAKNKKPSGMTIKLNSLVDAKMIEKLYEAAEAGVKINLIVRGICCAVTHQKSFTYPIRAISIIDEYLEHARVFVFHNQGNPKVFISSADWMVRNFDHRLEAACPVLDRVLKQELIDLLNIQLSENVKGRILDNHQKNRYIKSFEGEAEIRSQLVIYDYLSKNPKN